MNDVAEHNSEYPSAVSEPKTKCLDCSKIFKNKESLAAHRRDMHSGASVYPCPECGKTFGRKHNLKVTLDANI